MKKLFFGLCMLLAASANAEFRMIVPQAPGGGTSVWAEIIARHIEPFLGERVVVQHIPGAKDIPGFNEFHNKLRFDEKTIMVSHGGNAIGYLVDRVDYRYSDYESIGLMNLNIVVGKSTDSNLHTKTPVKIAGSSGMEADGMAIAMLLCGNLPTVAEYIDCWAQRVVWVNGMQPAERRMAFARGELDIARESTAAWIKNYNNSESTVWFQHGIYDPVSNKFVNDPNFNPETNFASQFYKIWKTEPRGTFYDAYVLSKSFRDVLQKALWVNKGNPHTSRLRNALKEMLNDPSALAALEKDTGKYQWIIGSEDFNVVENLEKNITLSRLETLVLWHQAAYKFPSILKTELVN